MKRSLRDPHDGWWSPEHRAWLRAVDRDLEPELLAELDELAIAAGDRLRAEAAELLADDERGRAYIGRRLPDIAQSPQPLT